jgi:hypothetical protein
LADLGLVEALDDLNHKAKVKNQAALEPVLVTPTGLVLGGFGHWRLAVLKKWPQINCIEYPLDEDEALEFMLVNNCSRRGWNDFARICVALKLEPSFQQQALDNQRAGGQRKGLASLPEAHHMDVRQKIADIAGVGARGVSKVKTILERAHPRVKEAALRGTIRIHRAFRWSELPKTRQLAELASYQTNRSINKVIRRAVGSRKEKPTIPDPVTVLRALLSQEQAKPGSVSVRMGRSPKTLILLGRPELAGTRSNEGDAS